MISIVVVALPPVLFAYTVYVVKVERTVGVPLISPFEVSKFNPLGKEGEISQVTTGPPLIVGETEFIGVPFVSVNVSGL